MNLDFENIEKIYLYRVVIYGVLSVFILIREYWEFFILNFESKVEYYCDNFEIANKIKILATNPINFAKKE